MRFQKEMTTLLNALILEYMFCYKHILGNVPGEGTDVQATFH